MNKKGSLEQFVVYGALTIAAITFIYPFIWMIGAALAPESEIGSLTLWPSHPTLGNFQIMMEIKSSRKIIK